MECSAHLAAFTHCSLLCLVLSVPVQHFRAALSASFVCDSCLCTSSIAMSWLLFSLSESSGFTTCCAVGSWWLSARHSQSASEPSYGSSNCESALEAPVCRHFASPSLLFSSCGQAGSWPGRQHLVCFRFLKAGLLPGFRPLPPEPAWPSGLCNSWLIKPAWHRLPVWHCFSVVYVYWGAAASCSTVYPPVFLFPAIRV